MTTGTIELVEVDAQPAAVVRGHVEVGAMAEFIGGAFEDVLRVLAEQGFDVSGPPFGRYVPVPGAVDAEVGFPASGAVEPAGRVAPAQLPGGPAAVAVHVGGYDGVGETYEALGAWVTARGCSVTGEPWESYLDGPDVAEPRTLVFLPCRPAAPPGAAP